MGSDLLMDMEFLFGVIKMFFFFFKYFFLMFFVFLERESARWGGAERVGEKENPKQAPGCQHRTRQGSQSHKP